jgi:hypothetical protein
VRARAPSDPAGAVAELVRVRDRTARRLAGLEERGKGVEVAALNGLAAVRRVLRDFHVSFDDVADLADTAGVYPLLAAAYPADGLRRSLR